MPGTLVTESSLDLSAKLHYVLVQSMRTLKVLLSLTTFSILSQFIGEFWWGMFSRESINIDWAVICCLSINSLIMTPIMVFLLNCYHKRINAHRSDNQHFSHHRLSNIHDKCILLVFFSLYSAFNVSACAICLSADILKESAIKQTYGFVVFFVVFIVFHLLTSSRDSDLTTATLRRLLLQGTNPDPVMLNGECRLAALDGL